MKKREARSYHKKMRAAMSKSEVQISSEQIARHILESPQFEQAAYILAYYPLGTEVSLLLVISHCLDIGKPIAFPRVNGARMDFYEIQKLSELSEGNFHVMEPLEASEPIKWSEEDTLILTPGVAFDRAGVRVGYGKGYYDYYFAAHPGCVRMGVAYENQVESEIELESHDIRVTYLATEAGITVC